MFCPECGTEYGKDALYCNFCGKKLPQNEKAKPQTIEKKFCTQCGSEYSPGAEYCPGCGQNISGSDNRTRTLDTGGVEKLLEMVYVRWNKNKGNRIGTRLYQKVLYFTEENIYLGEGTLAAGLIRDLFGYGGKSTGAAVEDKLLSNTEKEATNIDFNELVAQDPEIIIIPYSKIIKLHLEKNTMFKPKPIIKLSTADTDYEFIVAQTHKYKQYSQSLPLILGDKVSVER